MRSSSILSLCAIALLVGGCTTDGVGVSSLASSPAAKPRTVVVSDFVFSSDVVALDRGYTARLSRKVGTLAPHERKQKTAERVNDEIVATIVAGLRQAGIDAQPGSEEALSLSDDALIVSGRVRAVDESNKAQRKDAGFGTGRSGVVADMAVSHFATLGKRQVLSFSADGQAGKRTAAGKSESAAIAAAAAEAGADEKLSPDVEAQARAIGRAAVEKIVAYAREKGWLTKPEAATPTS